MDDKCNYCFKCDHDINFQKGSCIDCGQPCLTDRPKDWDLGVSKTGDRLRIDILINWLKSLGHDVIDGSKYFV